MNPYPKSTVILSDFDGTISLNDVTDAILARFADPKYLDIEQQWIDGQIGSKECMSKQIKLISATPQELDLFLKDIQIDAYFFVFADFIKTIGAPFQVLSDGLDYAINAILKSFDLPIYANQLCYQDNKKWDLKFPYAQPDCLKKSGNCKCAHLAMQRQTAEKVFYIGDGASDFCVAHHADMIFAKGKLIHYCQENDLPYLPIRHFGDVQRYLTRYFNEMRLRNA